MVDEGKNVGVQFIGSKTSAEILLEMKGVTFGYEREPILYGVHVQVRKGEMVGLLGPNGSGKTTLLRLVSGVLHPQQGKVVLEGRDLQDWGRRSIAQRLAVVPHAFHLPFPFPLYQTLSLRPHPHL